MQFQHPRLILENNPKILNTNAVTVVHGVQKPTPFLETSTGKCESPFSRKRLWKPTYIAKCNSLQNWETYAGKCISKIQGLFWKPVLQHASFQSNPKCLNIAAVTDTVCKTKNLFLETSTEKCEVPKTPHVFGNLHRKMQF